MSFTPKPIDFLLPCEHTRLAGDYKNIFGADLLSIILYGNDIQEEGMSNIAGSKCMVILSEAGIKSLAKAIPLAQKWKEYNVGPPLFLTKADILSSLDSFPIEFLNLKAAYVIVYGEDVIKNIVFDNRLVRIQCERDVKERLIKLRQDFFKAEGDVHKIKALIFLSLPGILKIFAVVIFMKKNRILADKEKLLNCMGQELGLNQALFAELIAISEGRVTLTSEKVMPLMECYMEEVKHLSLCVDQLEAASVTGKKRRF
ncbi:MAG: hypothetical protein WCQ99_06215 [Pseudomonadota bacterium]